MQRIIDFFDRGNTDCHGCFCRVDKDKVEKKMYSDRDSGQIEVTLCEDCLKDA